MRLPKEIRDKFVKAGKKGGKAGDPKKKGAATKQRMAELSQEERSAIASKAGKASAKARAKAKRAKGEA